MFMDNTRKSLSAAARLSLVLSGIFLLSSTSARAEEKKVLCAYRNESGRVVQVKSPDAIPQKFRGAAKCFYESSQNSETLAAPSEIALEGSQREEDMNTSVGRIHLRWERKSEKLFGRTPVRAMSDAANTLSRVLKNPAFPSTIQGLSQEWQIVFIGENIPSAQIPMQLITNCHPGWMTPPANIYIVSERAAGGCGGARSSTSVADSTLTEILLHEMGHAVEYRLLEGRDQAGDRARAEGFATFFSMIAARYSSILSPSSMESKEKELAKMAIMSSPNSFNFQGTGPDYARAAMYFLALEQKLGLRAVTEVYATISKKGLGFFEAIQESSEWDRKRLEKEVRSLLKMP